MSTLRIYNHNFDRCINDFENQYSKTRNGVSYSYSIFNKESQITGLSIILSICTLYSLLNNIEKQKAIIVKV